MGCVHLGTLGLWDQPMPVTGTPAMRVASPPRLFSQAAKSTVPG
jgi:hypothetical protein